MKKPFFQSQSILSLGNKKCPFCDKEKAYLYQGQDNNKKIYCPECQKDFEVIISKDIIQPLSLKLSSNSLYSISN